MEPALLAVVLCALAFDLSNGFHDSSNAIAALVATGAARPLPALLLSATFNLLGPVLAGTAVADTVAGVVEVDRDRLLSLLLAALVAALTWNLLTWWLGLPSSSSHALVGGLAGAGLVQAGFGAIRWGGLDGIRPVGVAGVLVGLAVSPLLGGLAAWAAQRAARRALRRATRRVLRPIRAGQWLTAAGLAFSHGANDAQKTMGLITLALVGSGELPAFAVPLWVKVACALALTAGSAFGGWRIVTTIGRGIYRIRALDGLVSQGAGAAVIGLAAGLGAPVSTTHVVAGSVVGVGAARRARHVRWPVVREMLLAWLVTLPACALLSAGCLLAAQAVG